MDSFTSLFSSITRQARVLLSGCLLLLVLFGIASAQSVQSQPVARLITGSDDSFSRPRVGLSVSVPGSVNAEVTNTVGSISLDQAFETERRAFNVTNDARVKNGLAPLTWDAELCRMARMHSENMARRKFFSHQTPEGFGLKERARSAGILHFKVLGENIAYNQGFEDPGAFAVERWLTSSQHRANILSQEFRASAVGTFVAGDGRVYLTQVFILR